VKKEIKNNYPRANFIFQPTAVIETYNGFHVYWILSTPVSVATH
jgi:hypothetical protein